MNDDIKVDKRLAKRSFERAARDYDNASVLQQEVNRHLLERFDYIRFTPQMILDLGAGTGFATYALQKRFADSKVIALDLAFTMLQVARSRQGLWSRLKHKIEFINGDAECLPLADASVDLVYSNLTVQWVNDLDKALMECRRVLKPGGMLLFSTFGPDTLRELRLSWQTVDQYSHVNTFIDMHDVGDAMMRAGFAEPVMDTEHFTLTYTDVYALMRDLKAIGAHNVTNHRARGLTGRAHFKALEKEYERFRQQDVLPASYEVVYGHAWIPQQATGDTTQSIHVSVDQLHDAKDPASR